MTCYDLVQMVLELDPDTEIKFGTNLTTQPEIIDLVPTVRLDGEGGKPVVVLTTPEEIEVMKKKFQLITQNINPS